MISLPSSLTFPSRMALSRIVCVGVRVHACVCVCVCVCMHITDIPKEGYKSLKHININAYLATGSRMQEIINRFKGLTPYSSLYPSSHSQSKRSSPMVSEWLRDASKPFTRSNCNLQIALIASREMVLNTTISSSL